MMTTAEVAETLGVSVNTVRRILKDTGLWWEVKKRMSYEFTDEQVERVARAILAKNRPNVRARVFVARRSGAR